MPMTATGARRIRIGVPPFRWSRATVNGTKTDSRGEANAQNPDRMEYLEPSPNPVMEAAKGHDAMCMQNMMAYRAASRGS